MKKVSIKDIAREVGVSTTTVSFVLNGKAKEKRISNDLRDKIQEVASRLNYKPNQLARGLRTGQTQTIGLIIEDISNPFFSGLAKAVEIAADRYGYKVMYCSTENNEEKAESILQMLRHRQMDGFIIVPTAQMGESISELIKDERPVVQIDRFLPDLPTHHVILDNYFGSREGTRHLLEAGYRCIGFVTNDMEQVQMMERERGYTETLKMNIPDATPLVCQLPFGQGRTVEMEVFEKFMDQHPEIDALIFATNYLGTAALQSLKNRNKQEAVKLGLVSFDDCDLFRLHTPAISAIEQPMDEIGNKAVEVLIRQLKHPDEPRQEFILPPRLIIRESSRQRINEVQLQRPVGK